MAAFPCGRGFDGVFKFRGKFPAGQVDFIIRESVGDGPAQGLFDYRQGLFPLFRRAFGIDLSGLDVIEIDARMNDGMGKGCFRVFQHFRQTVVDDMVSHAGIKPFTPVIGRICRLDCFGSHFYADAGGPGFTFKMVKRLGSAVGDKSGVRIDAFRRPGRDISKPVPDELIRGYNIEIAGHDQDHAFRPVPGVIKTFEHFPVCGFEYRFLADGQASGEQGVGKFKIKGFHKRPIPHGIPGPFFRQDHLAFPFDLVFGDQGARRVIPHDQKPLL